jgi:hypothetical protein
MTYEHYCRALDLSRQHPDSFLAGLEENGLKLTTKAAASALGYEPPKMRQIWPQVDAFICIVSKDLKPVNWAQESDDTWL